MHDLPLRQRTPRHALPLEPQVHTQPERGARRRAGLAERREEALGRVERRGRGGLVAGVLVLDLTGRGIQLLESLERPLNPLGRAEAKRLEGSIAEALRAEEIRTGGGH